MPLREGGAREIPCPFGCQLFASNLTKALGLRCATTGPWLKGSVATSNVGQAKAGRGLGLESNAEESRDEITLSFHVVRWCGRHLALADHRHDLVARNRP